MSVEGLAAVMEVLTHTRFTWTNEDDLQQGLDAALRGAGLDVAREVRLDARDRIDLVVGGVGIEVKIHGSWRDVTRQVIRYCTHESIGAVVLVTSRIDHRRLPISSSGKPVVVHRVGSTL